jgi:hypothetical protein
MISLRSLVAGWLKKRGDVQPQRDEARLLGKTLAMLDLRRAVSAGIPAGDGRCHGRYRAGGASFWFEQAREAAAFGSR